MLHFDATFEVEGLVFPPASIYDREMSVLRHCCWKFSLKETLWQTSFNIIEVDFYSKKRKSSLFEPPFGRLRGNVRTSSIARGKARVRLPIRHN